MKRTLTSLLLLLNGTGATFGGWSLVRNPDGSSLQLSPNLLTHTPFHDYLIPGIILLVANGLFSFIVLTLLLFRFRASGQFVAIQGVLLTGWICVQVILIRRFDILQLVFVAIGIGLILLGYNGRHTGRKATAGLH